MLGLDIDIDDDDDDDDACVSMRTIDPAVDRDRRSADDGAVVSSAGGKLLLLVRTKLVNHDRRPEPSAPSS
jgi:hypothetical protein